MINTEHINAFILYNYIPFDKKQCIKRLLTIWITSLILCFVGSPTLTWVLTLGIIDLSLSVIFLSLVVKHSQSQIARYLCDGFFWLYIAVFLNLTAYRIMVLQGDSNWILAIVLMASLVVCILLFLFITLSNIRSGKFSEPHSSKKTTSLPFFFGAIAILTARLSLQGAAKEVALTVLSYVLLILSFITSIPSINLLKALFHNRYFPRIGDGSKLLKKW